MRHVLRGRADDELGGEIGDGESEAAELPPQLAVEIDEAEMQPRRRRHRRQPLFFEPRNRAYSLTHGLIFTLMLPCNINSIPHTNYRTDSQLHLSYVLPPSPVGLLIKSSPRF
jgi:hypothetical protein